MPVAPPYPPTTHSIVSGLRRTHHQTATKDAVGGREGGGEEGGDRGKE